LKKDCILKKKFLNRTKEFKRLEKKENWRKKLKKEFYFKYLKTMD